MTNKLLIVLAFIIGFLAGAGTVKSLTKTANRFIPVDKQGGFESLDTVTGQTCVSASQDEVRERNQREAQLKVEADEFKKALHPNALDPPKTAPTWADYEREAGIVPTDYHGMPYCAELK